jgi:hypothetical protein
MAQHIAFIKKMVAMNYLDLKGIRKIYLIVILQNLIINFSNSLLEYEKRQKRSLGARLVSVRAEMVILAGSKSRIHRGK